MKITLTEKECEFLMSLLNEQSNYDYHKIYLKIYKKYDRLQVAKITASKQRNDKCPNCGNIVNYLNYKEHLYMYCKNKLL